MIISRAQCRAARAALGWSQSDLSAASDAGLSTVRGFENGGRHPTKNNLKAIRIALQEAGVTFLDYDGHGRGIRVKSDSGEEEAGLESRARG